jgi:hypothetical protein
LLKSDAILLFQAGLFNAKEGENEDMRTAGSCGAVFQAALKTGGKIPPIRTLRKPCASQYDNQINSLSSFITPLIFAMANH